MPRILAIDDSPVILKMLVASLTPLGYEVITAPDGEQGLAIIRNAQPDVVITDVMMPGISGYEVTRRIRRDPQFAYLPILVLTAQTSLEEKIRAFEAGADDHVPKPFQPSELAARLAGLLRRGKIVHTAQSMGLAEGDQAQVIAVHSLRGGVGCTSMAVNLAIALAGLWEAEVLLIDLVTTSGQAALMLDIPLRRTWADISQIAPNELDQVALGTIITKHASGLNVIPAPTSPTESESLTAEHLNAMFQTIRSQYDYIVVDLTHDFSAISLGALDTADSILLLLAPDLASVRSASAAIETYNKLGYRSEKIQVIVNWTFQKQGFARKEIEEALNLPIQLVIPFAPERFVSAINLGSPIVFTHPDDPIAALIEDAAFRMSKEKHQTLPPASPKPGWLRVKKRLGTVTPPHK